LEGKSQRPLKILDLGAGNGWLSNRLAARGHTLAAVDLGINDWDGLGAHRHYETDFICLQAEFDHLPLEDNQVDLVIFNASFHYSVNYEVTLREALRVLRPEGWVVVMDTAVYQNQSSGQQMVAEREAAFLRQHGFASNTLPSENFLTYGRIQELATAVNLQWQLIWPIPTWRRLARWLKVKLRRQREPAKFPLLVGRISHE
jgi:SAM-dependent methyltransferase